MKQDLRKHSARIIDRAADQHHGQYVTPTIPGNKDKDQATQYAISNMKQHTVRN
ncbi:MAG TPA: hypothetical protein VGE40_00835 [Bacilli bacterium]